LPPIYEVEGKVVPVFTCYDVKTCGGVDIWIRVFLTLTLDGDEQLDSRPGSFTPGERTPDNLRIGDWVGPNVDLDSGEKQILLTLPGT
jgi:hypothetical protein